MTELRRPVPLRDFLEAGCDPREALTPTRWGNLVAQIAEDQGTPSETRARRAEARRAHVEASLRGEALPIRVELHPCEANLPIARESEWPAMVDQAEITWAAWASDLEADPTLGPLLMEHLSTEDRFALEVDIDQYLRAHPLEVETIGKPWCCDGCGAEHGPDARACVVGDRAGHSDLEYPITYCGECLRAALANMVGIPT